ncbi:uncharacterized protein MELLADRAFT_93086 [Melampsora larici-populina 98AG31]|uniref:Alpha-type protein kinase domain-containing protein n=1 Tax=Melampsora larici-populina (strain 98AG31 / pathotype 3-4-7) TaxID=747676 RepID=F4S3W7_MELLP|nr:uncharacterized protein MELLADRAFT_93086 [Melampsora larici-populina 98AG31]EGG00668.1 hypothetical protein MELLADRAFT_93086 [Melampsora larici-populina 98AG31]
MNTLSPHIANAWDPPPPGKLDCSSCSRLIPGLCTTFCGYCIAARDTPGVKLVHCDSCSIGYPQLTGSPPVCCPCLAKDLGNSPAPQRFPRCNVDPSSQLGSNLSAKSPRASETYIEPPRMNNLTQFRLSNLGPPDVQHPDLVSEQQSNIWGRQRRLDSAESNKVGSSSLHRGGGAKATPGGFSGLATHTLNVTAQLVISTVPIKCPQDNGVRTYSNLITVSDKRWPGPFARAAWADVTQYCVGIDFPSAELGRQHHIFPIPTEFSNTYVSFGIGRDHMSYEQIQAHFSQLANHKAQRGPAPKSDFNWLTAFSLGLSLHGYLEDQPEDFGKSTAAMSESSSVYEDDNEFERVQDALRLSLQETDTPYQLRSKATSNLSVTSQGSKIPSWWFDPSNDTLPFWGSITDAPVTGELEGMIVNRPVVQDMSFISRIFGSDLQSADNGTPDLRFLGEIAIPISTTWANSTQALLGKNVVLLALHLQPVTQDPDLSLECPAHCDPTFKSLKAVGISIKPWRAIFHVDKGNLFPSSGLEDRHGGQILFEGSIINIVARRHLKGTKLLNYMEEFQMIVQAAKLLSDFQSFVAGKAEVPPPLAQLLKELEVVQLLIVSKNLWSSPLPNDLWMIETADNKSPKKYVSPTSKLTYTENDPLFQALHAWSHWTFHLYKGEALLSEISADGNLLSGFQMVDSNPKMWWSAENTSEKGVWHFANSHVCSPLCEALGLLPVNPELHRPRGTAMGLLSMQQMQGGHDVSLDNSVSDGAV